MENKGCYRNNLRSGLDVAIVLKEDQRTGKLTYGKVAQVLTPSDFHHRGIKVRLKDGNVGRVQQIIDPSMKKPSTTPKNLGPAKVTLVILAVQDFAGRLYCRKMESSESETILTLGLDGKCEADTSPEQIANQLAQSVVDLEGSPRALLQLNLDLGPSQLEIHGYYCRGQNVVDSQKPDWTWTGWLAKEELEEPINLGQLSEESLCLYRKIE